MLLQAYFNTISRVILKKNLCQIPGHLCSNPSKGILFHSGENPNPLEQSAVPLWHGPLLQSRLIFCPSPSCSFYLRHTELLAVSGRFLCKGFYFPGFLWLPPLLPQGFLTKKTSSLILNYKNLLLSGLYPIPLMLFQFFLYHLSLHEVLYIFDSLLIYYFFPPLEYKLCEGWNLFF